MTAPEHLDVIIVGAGLSGVGAACHLRAKCPTRSFAVLEARDAIGGTWDLFRYPGVRSDSDMYTLGYPFRPWREPQAIAAGAAILDYIRDTARASGVDRKIRFSHRVKRASWSSRRALWTLEVEQGPDNEVAQFTCGFLFTCTGYYDYAQGYTPELPGVERFRGRVVHPQAWPDDLDYAGKRVVVIGSGATAVTLVPAMARTAAHVVMLQRTPSYVVALPSQDPLASGLRRRLPPGAAYRLVRWRNLLVSMIFYTLARRRPAQTRARLLGWVRAYLGPDYDVASHFTPPYDPWDQRVCMVPDGDLFEAINNGRASVVTDRIATFTEGGLRLESGEELEADLVVTATGLRLQLLGDMRLDLDGVPAELSESLIYKGAMYSGVPNLASAIGYTNASWTLKCDLTSDYVCRLLNYMDRRGYAACMPRLRGDPIGREPAINFTSSYVRRSIQSFPRQGSRAPWRLRQNYLLDLIDIKLGGVADASMEFRARL